jgi:hypothetical protein
LRTRLSRFFRLVEGALDRRDETIPAARQRFDEPRGVSRVAEGIAQPFDRGVQTVLEIDEGLPRPETGAQLLACNELSGLFKQDCEDLKRLLLKREPHTRLS